MRGRRFSCRTPTRKASSHLLLYFPNGAAPSCRKKVLQSVTLTYCHRPPERLTFGKVEAALGGTVRQRVAVTHGIADEKAKAVGKLLRQRFKKVKVQIQGDTVRVFSAKKDELQAAMQALRDEDFGIPLQFTNYR